ncbi:uncharacterized protein LOC114535873 [Dendronephthya gigantea]|uniref:uncharacterized protein LOC114535873 n=1 Tax=Dendronephthya gigantea TaxID=151771 RepID=UPI00106C5A2E|nr:uncharacterized protein LOC114535873 [Dendronephthya gigantea]
MLVFAQSVITKMRIFCAILLIFCSRQTGVDSEREYLKQVTLTEARPISSTAIYLAWKGPIKHPGGIGYSIHLKKGSSTIQQQKNITGSISNAIVDGLEGNMRYEVCVNVVDKHYKTTRSTCNDVVVITTPAQLGHVSKTDTKYLNKGGFYRGASHYWPLDYETQIRDVRYSRDGKWKGTRGIVTGENRGYLSLFTNGWVRLGKFLGECLCDIHLCTKNGFSVAFWVKLPIYDNETKILLGSDTNDTGLMIFQTTRAVNGTDERHISAIVFMKQRKWQCDFPTKPGNWFIYLHHVVKSNGLRMFKDSVLMSEETRAKIAPGRAFKQRYKKCAVVLSPPTVYGTTLKADYDDIVIWHYELSKNLMNQVYRNTLDRPKIEECKTNGTSLNVLIDDRYQTYKIERDFRITWWRNGVDGRGKYISKALNFSIHHLVQNSEYIVEVQRRMFVSKKNTSKMVVSKSSRVTCNTKLNVPGKPKNFAVREKAARYFLLEWEKIDGPVQGYKISYRKDDFRIPEKWSTTFRGNVASAYLEQLEPFTEYIITLACKNEHGTGQAVTLREKTAEGLPMEPRYLRVKQKGEILVIKWRQPKELNGLVDYTLFALVNGNEKTICSACGESYRLEYVEQYTEYTFWVIARNIKNGYTSPPSNNVTITTPSFTPSSPRNLTATFTQNGIHVSWETSKVPRGQVEYKLFGRVNGHQQLLCDECNLQYLMKNVARNTQYGFWAVAYNVHKGYESAPTGEVIIDTGLYVPTTPAGLRVSLLLEGILISWNKSQVEYGRVRHQLLGLENNVKKVFCWDCGLKYLINKSEPNMNYSFWVVAHNMQNGYESIPSSVVDFHTARSKPPPPELILAPEVKDSSARITWSPPKSMHGKDDVIGYKVTLYNAFNILHIETTESLQLELSNLTQFSKYYVTVQVLSGAGYGRPSQQFTIQTKDTNECIMDGTPCGEHAQCVNSAGSYFCSCLPGFAGDGIRCKALPSEVTETDFCPEEKTRNVTWKRTYRGQTDKNLCPNGTIGITTRECLKGNASTPYWSDPNLSNCVSSWMSAVDDKLADQTLNSTVVGDFFLNLLDKNGARGLYGGDIIKTVNVIDQLYNKSQQNELNEELTNQEITESLLTNLVNITEKIISPKSLKVWDDIPKEQRSEYSVRIIDGLDNAVLKSAKIVNFSSIQSEHIGIRYGKVSHFKRNTNTTSSEKHMSEMDSIKFPEQEEGMDIEDQTAAVILYNTIEDVMSAGNQQLDDKDFVNTAVLSISTSPPVSTPFRKPLEFILKNEKDGQFDKHKCVFFNTSRNPGSWSTTGCEVFNVTRNFTVCHCYHMTSFSVLMQIQPVEMSDSEELILSWITRVGLCISLVALGLAFITFVFLPRPCGYKSGSQCFKLCDQGYRPTYLKKVRTSIHANLILSLALGEALFLWGIEKTNHERTCYAVAVALHYLLLVAFHWMAAEGVILYLVLVKVFQRKSANKDKRMFMIICWGTPAAIVCIALVVGHEYYLHDKCCWLSMSHHMIWGFVGPALGIILVNIFFLCCTFRVMGRRQSCNKTEKNMMGKIRYWAKGAAIVTCLLGITWVFGVFYLNNESVVVAYIFNICNVLQGLFIFVFHCLLDEKIRQQYYQVFCAVTNIESRSPSHSTGNGNRGQRPSTFNSWLWSVAPMKLQDSKSESCPTVAENTLKRMNSSTHSLTPCIDRRLMEIKRDGHGTSVRPRGMSSIYHDSDENMDNIPDNILTVKHGSKNNSGRLDYQDEDTKVFLRILFAKFIA